MMIPLPGLLGPAMTRANPPPITAKPAPAGGKSSAFARLVAALLPTQTPATQGEALARPALGLPARTEGGGGSPLLSLAPRLDRTAGAETSEQPLLAAYEALAALLWRHPADTPAAATASAPALMHVPQGPMPAVPLGGPVAGQALGTPAASTVAQAPPAAAPPVEAPVSTVALPTVGVAPRAGTDEPLVYARPLAGGVDTSPDGVRTPAAVLLPTDGGRAPQSAAGFDAPAALAAARAEPATAAAGQQPGDASQREASRERGGDVETPAASALHSTQALSRADATVAVARPEPVPARDATALAGRLAETVRDAALVGDRQVRLLLDPPELGRLAIRIEEGPQGLRVLMEAATSEAREVIERALPVLQSALESRELRVERLQVQQAPTDASDREADTGAGSQREAQRDAQREQAPEWSPLASMELGGAGTEAARRPGARATAGTLDVLA